MNLGDLSVLGESTEKPEGHTWANPMDGYCLAYHRDGFESFKIERGHDSSDIDIYMQDYNYIFQDGKWSCVDYYGKDVPI